MGSTLKVILWWWGIGGAAVVALVALIPLFEVGIRLAKATHPVIVIMWFYIIYGVVGYTLLISFAPFRWLARHIQP